MSNNSPADRKRPVRGCICMISRPHQLSPFPIDLGRRYFTEFHGAVNHRLNGNKIKHINLIACRISYTDQSSWTTTDRILATFNAVGPESEHNPSRIPQIAGSFPSAGRIHWCSEPVTAWAIAGVAGTSQPVVKKVMPRISIMD